jgi:hypothetical protein
MHMSEKGLPSNPGDPSRETREVWDRNADFWDGRMSEGNEFHTLLVAPSQERLLRWKNHREMPLALVAQIRS